MEHATQVALAQRFHALHHAPDMLILPNAWDAGSAVIFEKAGFVAIGSTSAGIAYTLGYPDGQRITLPEMIETERHMLRRLTVPLSVDIESGYGTNVAQVVTSIRQVIEAGAVGLNLEDGLSGSDAALIPLDEQCSRIQALVALKTELGIPFFINARTDVYWLSLDDDDNRLSAAIERCSAYLEAGADGIFVPGQLAPAVIRKLVESLNAPLNVIASPANPTVAELRMLGVSRLSLGSGPARAVLGLAQKIAAELYRDESFASMISFATPYHDMNRLFE
jgi:2-methylisocitrate lyase-like PEP mutase family enzyme